MSSTVRIGGEDRTIGDFSAYKAIEAIRLISDVEAAYREVLKAGSSFRKEFTADNMIELGRAEARRQFRPRVLTRETQTPRTAEVDGEHVPVTDDAGNAIVDVTYDPVLEAGVPVMGPDPLGHLDEADWQASGNKLQLPNPDAGGGSDGDKTGELAMAAMIPPAFKLARVQVLRIIVLALTPNSDLEKWDGDALDVDGQLDAEAKKLVHRASVAELMRLAVGIARIVREQVADPFGEAKAAWKEWQDETTDDTPATPATPATFETVASEPTTSPPTSSTSSPAATDGTPEPSSTEPAGVS